LALSLVSAYDVSYWEVVVMQTIIRFTESPKCDVKVDGFDPLGDTWYSVELESGDGDLELRLTENQLLELVGVASNELARQDQVRFNSAAGPIEATYTPTDEGVSASVCNYIWHDEEFARCLRGRNETGNGSMMADWLCTRCDKRLIDEVPHETRMVIIRAVHARTDDERISLGCMSCGCIPASHECVTGASWMPLTDRPTVSVNA
jgi:hypothetical protein